MVKKSHVEKKKVVVEPKEENIQAPANERTVFVGNLPSSTSKQELKRHFADCGSIESVRVRSFKKHEHKRRTNSRDATYKSELNPGSIFGYVQFESNDSIESAVGKSGSTLGGNIIRVDSCTSTGTLDPSRTAFLGNVPRTATENAVYTLFQEEGIGKISTIRLVRDSYSGECRGFGFIMFEDSQTLKSALKLTEAILEGRPLRIFPASDRLGTLSSKRKSRDHSQDSPSWTGKRSKKTEFAKKPPRGIR